jgi:hypothetical protein
MPGVEEIHVVHHSHTDIGYTHEQPVVWDLHRRFIDRAIDLAERDRDGDDPSAFRWTVETIGPLLRWLETAGDERIETFVDLEAAGRIEVTGMLSNTTPLYDQREYVESLEPVRRLRETYGFDIAAAMNGDVNGQNWPLADRLLDAGIGGFSMAANRHWGRTTIERPLAFRWEAPSGRELLAYNGFQYGGGYNFGIGRDAEALRERWWPRIERHLDRIDYPLPVVMIQTTHPFFDNNPPMRDLPEFVASWNEQDAVADGELPRIRVATPATWWEVVDDHREDLPVHRGDWTDFWSFGGVTSARETAENRESRRRLRTAEAFDGALAAAGSPLSDARADRRSDPGQRGRAWWNLLYYDEHTWGADISVDAPEAPDTRAQWNHKANMAHEARSLSLMEQRDAVAELARRVAVEGDER